jgi:tripartite-type tricarboxylate transporter receptor subunit TctC
MCWCPIRRVVPSTSWPARLAMSYPDSGANRCRSGPRTPWHFYDKLPYDTFRDFTSISLIGSSPNMILVRADSPLKSVGDVIAKARANPGQLSYGHAGNGTSPYLSGELFKYMQRSRSRRCL